MKIGRQVAVTLYMRPDQKAALEKLSKKTGRPQQEFIREGIDLVLANYKGAKK